MSFAERYHADGWLKIGKVFDPAFIGELREEFEQQFDELTNSVDGKRSHIVVGDERIMLSVQLKGPFLDRRLYAHPLLLKMLSELLGGNLLAGVRVEHLEGVGELQQRRASGRQRDAGAPLELVY